MLQFLEDEIYIPRMNGSWVYTSYEATTTHVRIEHDEYIQSLVHDKGNITINIQENRHENKEGE